MKESKLARLGSFIAAKRWWVIAAGVVATIVFGVVGAGVPGQLTLSRFEAPGSESILTREAMEETFQAGPPNVLLLVEAKNGNVDSPEVAKAGEQLAEAFGNEEGVAEVTSYWSQGGSPVLKSEDSSRAMILGRMAGDATEARAALTELSPRYTTNTDVMSVRVGGQDEVFREVGAQSQQDFVRAEMIVFPGVFVLLLLIFRRVSAALLTLAVGIFTIVGSLALLRGVLPFADISTFALNLILVMGLGLGIDYCLFIISRFREEVAKKQTIAEAVAKTVQTAGRTVIFSGVTVAAALAVLFVFPFPFLHSFGYAGIAIVLMGIIGAVVVLPAALAVLGKRVVPKRSLSSTENGAWYKTALAVMRRPLLYGGMALAFLLALGAPVLNFQFGAADDRILPETAASRQVQDDIRTNFTSEQADALYVVSKEAVTEDDAAAYAKQLSQVEGISQVNAAEGVFAAGEQVAPAEAWNAKYRQDDAVYFEATPTIAQLENDPNVLVNGVRGVSAPFATTVGGYPAELYDFRTVLMERMPIALGLIFITTFIILFLMTSSVILPLKAIIMNTLSLSVMFGALVWIFQEGNLADIIGFTPTGVIEPSIPILMFCIAYGLSMDYEVFILSRIKEEWEKTKDNRLSVARGIQRSGPLVTAAAVILAFTFASYASSDITFLQMLGIGMALSVIVDATVIRGVLVPAFMQISSKVNWWAPVWMRQVADKIGLKD